MWCQSEYRLSHFPPSDTIFHIAFEDLRLADLPQSLLIKKDYIAYQGVHLQTTIMDLLRSLKAAFQVTEKEAHYLNTKVIAFDI